MADAAVTREWHDEDGWGVIDCVQTPGGCWAHCSDVAVPGYRSLTVGAAVWLEWERCDQDGYAYRATRIWPVGADPVPATEPTTASNAYRSRLVIDISGRGE